MGVTYTIQAGTDPEELDSLGDPVDEMAFAVDEAWGYNITAYWRVDATNEFGTTSSDVQSFTTIPFDPPLPTVYQFPDGQLPDWSYGDGINYGGTEGDDWEFRADNGQMVRKKLVVAAKGRIWIED